MSKLVHLRQLLETGQFHHATYRNRGTVWEGLYIYKRNTKGFRGYELALCFNAYMKDPELSIAEDMVRQKGISLGSYGQG